MLLLTVQYSLLLVHYQIVFVIHSLNEDLIMFRQRLTSIHTILERQKTFKGDWSRWYTMCSFNTKY